VVVLGGMGMLRQAAALPEKDAAVIKEVLFCFHMFNR
jgi:hypothetical protein